MKSLYCHSFMVYVVDSPIEPVTFWIACTLSESFPDTSHRLPPPLWPLYTQTNAAARSLGKADPCGLR